MIPGTVLPILYCKIYLQYVQIEIIMITTVIIDARKQDRDRITALLAKEGNIKVLAQGKDGYDALKLAGSLKPDVLIMDNHLDFIEGGEASSLLKARSPLTMIVILARRISDYQLYIAAANMVSGLVHKETDLDMLPEVLKYISNGECFISPALAAGILRILSSMNGKFLNPAPGTSKKSALAAGFASKNDPAGRFSKTELAILTHLGEGLSSNEIAEQLGLAVGTVRNYISFLMNKLRMKSRIRLARYALINGLVVPERGSHLFI